MQPPGPTLVAFFILSFTSVWSLLKFWAGVDFMIVAMALVRNSVSVCLCSTQSEGSLFKVKFWAGVDFMIALALMRNNVSVVSVALIVRGESI